MAYNTQSEIENAITAKTRAGLFTDSGTETAGAFTQALDRASAYLNAALSTAGYSVPIVTTGLPTDTVNLLKELELAVFLKRYAGRKGLKLSQSYQDVLDVLPGIISGSVPLPGVSPSSSTAVGGVTWTSSTDDTGNAPVFGGSDSSGNRPLDGGY